MNEYLNLIKEYESFPLSDYEKAPEIFAIHELGQILARDYSEKENEYLFELRFKRYRENLNVYLRSNIMRVKESEEVIKESTKKNLSNKEIQDVEELKEQVNNQIQYINTIKSSLQKVDNKIKENIAIFDKIEELQKEAKNIINNFEHKSGAFSNALALSQA